MYLISGQRDNLTRMIVVAFLILFVLISCSVKTDYDSSAPELEYEIMQRGTTYIENGQYEKAYIIYSQFIHKFPAHPYVDDAAYRLGYIHVIADDNNPYFNYGKAAGIFQKFIENYPNSRYINACRNWQNVLHQIDSEQTKTIILPVEEPDNSVQLDLLEKELNKLQGENNRLKETLQELQRAIER